MRGRKPKPTPLKILDGNPGKRPIKEEPKIPGDLPECPEELDDAARAEWARVIELLKDLGFVKQTDRAIMAAYCQCYSRWLEAEKQLRKVGPVLMTPNKMPMLNPYLSIANKALDQVKKFGAELGFTPTARTRVNAEPPNQGDEDAQFLDRRA